MSGLSRMELNELFSRRKNQLKLVEEYTMTNPTETERERFEKWISAPPIEAETERQQSGDCFPGHYKTYRVQLAWEAWQEAGKEARKP
jgi:hypothetical protein